MRNIFFLQHILLIIICAAATFLSAMRGTQADLNREAWLLRLAEPGVLRPGSVVCNCGQVIALRIFITVINICVFIK